MCSPVSYTHLEESAGGEQLPALLDEKQIMAIIANKDDDLKYKKNQIELFFSVHSDVQERADYLKSAYQDRYTEIIADGQRLGYKPQENGLLMWEGSYPSRTKESVFSWDIVAQWTAQLIDKKEYFIQTDIPRLPDQESQQMSLFDFAAFNQPTQAEGTACLLYTSRTSPNKFFIPIHVLRDKFKGKYMALLEEYHRTCLLYTSRKSKCKVLRAR